MSKIRLALMQSALEAGDIERAETYARLAHNAPKPTTPKGQN